MIALWPGFATWAVYSAPTSTWFRDTYPRMIDVCVKSYVQFVIYHVSTLNLYNTRYISVLWWMINEKEYNMLRAPQGTGAGAYVREDARRGRNLALRLHQTRRHYLPKRKCSEREYTEVSWKLRLVLNLHSNSGTLFNTYTQTNTKRDKQLSLSSASIASSFSLPTDLLKVEVEVCVCGLWLMIDGLAPSMSTIYMIVRTSPAVGCG